MRSIFEAKSITKEFNNHRVVNSINLRADKGQLIAFLGPNGVGKSTTIDMLTGLISPTKGKISLSGVKVNSAQFRNKIGVVFQDSVLDHNLTVLQNLITRAKLYPQFSQAYFEELIRQFELENILDKKYGILSGGQRRRVDIVRALVHEQELLFLDEPSTGLDIQTRNKIWDILNEIRHKKLLTIILTTHYLEEAEYSDYVYVIDHGKIIAENTLNKLKVLYSHDVLSLNLKDNSVLHNMIDKSTNQPFEKQIEIATNSKVQAITILNSMESEIESFEMKTGSVDDIFIELTGKEIR
ncbi:ATP-binding cassette domain-containing protein [Paucilactobacillus nenjiangensis]|uniref:ABC transporter ATP-binding protein n=1 Tax=Paucilactobacillus nenjiangensis TaxID=1296540 RepID=UPI003F9C2EAF